MDHVRTFLAWKSIISVESPEGYDENTQRAVRENCGTLNFKQAEFDEE